MSFPDTEAIGAADHRRARCHEVQRALTDRRKLLTDTDVLACRAGWTMPDLPSWYWRGMLRDPRCA